MPCKPTGISLRSIPVGDGYVMRHNPMALRLLRYALLRALRKPTPNPIPRSGDAGAAVDGYVIYLRDSGSDLQVLIDKLDQYGVYGRALKDDTYELDVVIPTRDLQYFKVEIQHYYGLWQFNYFSPLRFIVQDILNFPMWVWGWNAIQQSIFNRRRLVRRERISVLQELVERTIQDPRFKISHIGLVGGIYTHRWVHHPTQASIVAYYKLALDSLVESGDLNSDGMSYTVSSKALETLSRYEEQDRKHRDNVKQKRALNWLTLVLVLLGALQVYAALIANGA